MNRVIQIVIIVVLVAAAVFLLIRTRPEPAENNQEPVFEPEVVVDTPAYGTLVASPLKVSGRARGTWFFEANLSVTLKDSNGKVLAKKGFMATEEWMTEDFVEFEGTLEFATPETELGVLLIEKDNPSGLPENDAAFAVPVRFK